MTSNTGSQGRPDGAALALARELENLRRTVERVAATAASAKETAETAVRTAARGTGRNDQVEGLRTQLGEVVTQLLTVATTVSGLVGLAHQVTQLSEQVTALAQRLAGDDNPEPSAPAAPAFPSWFEVTGEQAQAMLLDLAGWVDTILVRHQAAVDCLPPCWMFHGEVVEDLLWLKACWMAAHRDPAARPTAAADWHERWLPGVTGRLRHRLGTGGCSFANHRQESTEYRVGQERHPDQRVPAVDPDTAAAYARWWVQTRGRSDVTPPGLPAPRPQQGGAQPPRGWGQ